MKSLVIRVTLITFLVVGVIIACWAFIVHSNSNLEEVLNKHVQITTEVKVDVARDEPYLLTVEWYFPEGSYFYVNDVLGEEYYKEGYWMLLSRGVLLSTIPEGKWLPRHLYELKKDSYEYSVSEILELMGYEGNDIDTTRTIRQDFSFRTEEAMLKIKSKLEDTKRWAKVYKQFKNLYFEEKERLEKMYKDAEKYNEN